MGPSVLPDTVTAAHDPGRRPGLSRLLGPRSVAVVGATDRPGSYAGETLRNLRATPAGLVLVSHDRALLVSALSVRRP